MAELAPVVVVVGSFDDVVVVLVVAVNKLKGFGGAVVELVEDVDEAFGFHGLGSGSVFCVPR